MHETYCYRCDAVLDPSKAHTCPKCGRTQTRVCFCGERLRKDVAVCPKCETDWQMIEALEKAQRDEHRAQLRAEFWRRCVEVGVVLLVGGLIVWLMVAGAR